MNEVVKIDESRNLKQSNRLIEARYSLTKYEQRLMIAICSQIKANDDDFNKVRIKVSDIANFCKFEPQKSYTLVKSTIMKLLRRTLEIKYPDGNWYATHWLQSAKYIASESVIEYKLDEELKPELLQLKSAYLSTSAGPLMEFSRDYSIRMYFILKKMLKIRDFQKELDFFRDRFQLGKTYDKISNLKDKVIEPALAEINEKSDIKVWHEYIKEGRTYTKIHFIVELKQTDKKEIVPPAQIDSQSPVSQLTTPVAPVEKQVEQTPQPTQNVTSTSTPTPGIRLLQAIGLNPPPSVIKRAMEKATATEPAEPTFNTLDNNMLVTQTQPQEETVASTAPTEGKKNWSDQQQADYDLMLKHGVWAQTARKYIVTYDHARIERNIQGVLKSNPKGNIRDIGAVMANAIANDTYMGEAEEKAKAQARAIERAKAEAIKAEKELIKDNERREKNAIRNEELAKIRENKSKKELVETFEKVLVEYENNNKILTDEMRAELAANGIPETDFYLYQSETMRSLIKYLK